MLSLLNELGGGYKMGANRFEAGKKGGMPQVFAPAAVEWFWLDTNEFESRPIEFRSRKSHQHNIFGIMCKSEHGGDGCHG